MSTEETIINISNVYVYPTLAQWKNSVNGIEQYKNI